MPDARVRGLQKALRDSLECIELLTKKMIYVNQDEVETDQRAYFESHKKKMKKGEASLHQTPFIESLRI